MMKESHEKKKLREKSVSKECADERMGRSTEKRKQGSKVEAGKHEGKSRREMKNTIQRTLEGVKRGGDGAVRRGMVGKAVKGKRILERREEDRWGSRKKMFVGKLWRNFYLQTKFEKLHCYWRFSAILVLLTDILLSILNFLGKFSKYEIEISRKFA